MKSTFLFGCGFEENEKYSVEFIISNVDWLFHQTLAEEIIFQIILENNFMKNMLYLKKNLH